MGHRREQGKGWDTADSKVKDKIVIKVKDGILCRARLWKQGRHSSTVDKRLLEPSQGKPSWLTRLVWPDKDNSSTAGPTVGGPLLQ